MSAPLPAGQEFTSSTFKKLAATDEELTRKVFEECEFKDCNFSGARLSRCRFVDCAFLDCNFSNARVGDSKFLNVEFTQCKMIGINWTEAAWPRVAVNAQLTFWKSILDDSSFFGLKLQELVIRDCRVHRVDFRGTDLTRAELTGSDLQGSLFGKTILVEADFSRAVNYSIDVLDNSIRKARFSRDEVLGLLGGFDIDLVD